ncbi:MAG: class I SAM-dependent methyltransferase [Alphaproteobacteria bacterium]|nr:class I SAM-dependent methyltransferase [Alphaproteobacteria bacterium]
MMRTLYRSAQAIGRVCPEALKKPLRGEYDSVSNRFLERPLFLAEIALQRLMGHRYLEWYAARLNKDETTGRELAERPVMESGDEDLEALRRLGLEPHHTLYEFGLGFGRSAQHFIAYLDQGHYAGNDITANRVRMFREYLDLRGLADKQPEMHVTRDNSFDWVAGRTFDYIWCGAVLCHMPDEDVAEVLSNIRRIMAPHSIFLMTDTHLVGQDHIVRYTSKDWFRPANWYRETGEACGLVAEDVSDMLSFGKGSHHVATPLGEAGGFKMGTHLIKYTLPENP